MGVLNERSPMRHDEVHTHSQANLPSVCLLLLLLGNTAVVIFAKCTWPLAMLSTTAPPTPVFNDRVVSIIKYLSWPFLRYHGNIGQRSAGKKRKNENGTPQFLSFPLCVCLRTYLSYKKGNSLINMGQGDLIHSFIRFVLRLSPRRALKAANNL